MVKYSGYFYSKVQGETFESRQKELRSCYAGEQLDLVHETIKTNGSNAIGIFRHANRSQLGYIDKELANDLTSKMNCGFAVTAFITAVTQSHDGEGGLGCNVVIIYSNPGDCLSEAIWAADGDSRTAYLNRGSSYEARVGNKAREWLVSSVPPRDPINLNETPLARNLGRGVGKILYGNSGYMAILILGLCGSLVICAAILNFSDLERKATQIPQSTSSPVPQPMAPPPLPKYSQWIRLEMVNSTKLTAPYLGQSPYEVMVIDKGNVRKIQLIDVKAMEIFDHDPTAAEANLEPKQLPSSLPLDQSAPPAPSQAPTTALQPPPLTLNTHPIAPVESAPPAKTPQLSTPAPARFKRWIELRMNDGTILIAPFAQSDREGVVIWLNGAEQHVSVDAFQVSSLSDTDPRKK